MKLTLIGPGLLHPATLLLNRPLRGLLPKMNRALILYNNDDIHYADPKKRKYIERLRILSKILPLYPQGQL